MTKVLVILSCGHHVEVQGPYRPQVADHFLDAKHANRDVICHRGTVPAHESFVVKVLTSNVDRLWIEEL
jgi:hypothetical protein